MRVTTKGQVTIPQHIRENLGITPATEIDFVEEKDRVFIVKRKTLWPQYSVGFCQSSVANRKIFDMFDQVRHPH